MLVSMSVRNVALIESLEVRFHEGLHVLTGETGAGKSIVVDSINLILGERADRGLIRTGCEKATVEAVFDISDSPQVKRMLDEASIEMDGSLLTVLREISTTDRNLCRICGMVMPLSFLRQISALLVDVHGQHEHQSLLNDGNHLGFLDAFGDDAYQALRQEVAGTYHAWREIGARFSAMRKSNAQRAERMEYNASRLKELDAAKLQIGEEAQLEKERTMLADSERIHGALETSYRNAAGSEGAQQSAMLLLKQAADAMRGLSDYDTSYAKLAERLMSSYYEVEEMGVELRDMLESQSFDPDRNDAIQERLDLYRRLERRYGKSGDELVEYAETLRDEQRELRNMDSRLQEVEAEYKTRLATYRDAAKRLTVRRKELAKRFEALMESQLADLGMNRTLFRCIFAEPAEGQRHVPSVNGDDQVTFHIAPNLGEPLKPLAKTASGGELSRIMLAMKAAAADRNMIPCMVFDEIDTGISGRIASVVAEKMACIAKYRQVICVTHLAQIAAMADTQYRVAKHVVGERTVTDVEELDENARVEELARLVGASDTHAESGYAHARSMLLAAAEHKERV